MKKNILILIAIIISCAQAEAQQLLTLDQCRNMAIENSKDLKIRQEQITVAQSMKRVAFSQYLPNLSGKGAYTHNNNNVSLLSEDKFAPVGTVMSDGSFGFTKEQVNNGWTAINGQPVPLDANNQPFNPKANPEKIQWKNYAYLPKDAFTMDASNIFAASLAVVQPIYMGGKIREYNRMAGYAIKAAEAHQDGTLSDILYSVDEAYWQVVSVSNKLVLAQEYNKLIEQLMSDITAAAQEGLATKSDILRVRVKLNESELNVIKAHNGLNLSQMLLCQIIGIPVASELSLADQEIKIDNIAKDNARVSLEQVYGNRAEIKMLTQAINVSESEMKIKRSAYLPSIGLTSSYSMMNPNPFNGFSHDFGGIWMTGVAVNVPIFHWGERTHKMKAALAEHNISIYNLEAAKEKIELQVQQSEYRVDESVKRLTMTYENVESAAENVRYAQEGYKEGVVTLTDFMAAQTAWQSAYNEKIDAAIEYMLCKTYFRKVTGRLK